MKIASYVFLCACIASLGACASAFEPGGQPTPVVGAGVTGASSFFGSLTGLSPTIFETIILSLLGVKGVKAAQRRLAKNGNKEA